MLRETDKDLNQSRPESIRFVEAGVAGKLDSPLAGVGEGMVAQSITFFLEGLSVSTTTVELSGIPAS